MPPRSHLVIAVLLWTLASTVWTTDLSNSARPSLSTTRLQEGNISNSTLPDPGLSTVQEATLINPNTLTSPYHQSEMYLNYTLQADISGAALRSLIGHLTKLTEIKIRQGMGEERVGPPPGYVLIEADDIGLEMSAADIPPWIMTWRDLFGLFELAWYCFVEKRVFYAFKANVWIEDVFREIIDVQMWKPPGGDVGGTEIV